MQSIVNTKVLAAEKKKKKEKKNKMIKAKDF